MYMCMFFIELILWVYINYIDNTVLHYTIHYYILMKQIYLKNYMCFYFSKPSSI